MKFKEIFSFKEAKYGVMYLIVDGNLLNSFDVEKLVQRKSIH